MPSKKRLGKGLGALLGDTGVEGDSAPAEDGIVREIGVERISPNRFQPRHTVREEGLDELAASIREKGVLQPVIVAPRDGEYELISGERRWRAARRAGLRRVPAIVRVVDDRERLEIALVENLQREDLDPIDEALGYRRLVDEFDLTQAELAERVGKSRPAIANALRLLELPEPVRQSVKEGALTAGHARALLGLEDRERLGEIAAEIEAKGLSVRQVERRVRRENRRDDAGAEGDDAGELQRVRLEEELQRALGTRVRIHAAREGRGRIEVAFYSWEDLDRLVEQLKGGAR
ncbi:MAG: ParB/RepB/Spo0J family partition protein [Gemmatimonadota bacterium]|nr:ParB/RepB/Spo0J family partition protein [Gemmatimonadota bacterium]